MSTRVEQNRRDQKLLEAIEEALTGRASAKLEEGTLQGFCYYLARAIPQAKPSFQSSLEAQLMAKWGQEENKASVGYIRLDLPIGRWYMAFNRRGICCLAPAPGDREFQELFRERFGRPIEPALELPAKIAHAVKALQGGKGKIAAPLDLAGLSPFVQEVLAKSREIPRGEVRSYRWLAKEVGRPRAARAVGAALGANPVPLLIPCHRVVASDGSLGGYAWGLEEKERILAWEGLDLEAQKERARQGIRYYGCANTRIYCEPTCRYARKVAPVHLVHFHSREEAERAGFRPCRVCRPGGYPAGEKGAI